MYFFEHIHGVGIVFVSLFSLVRNKICVLDDQSQNSRPVRPSLIVEIKKKMVHFIREMWRDENKVKSGKVKGQKWKVKDEGTKIVWNQASSKVKGEGTKS